MKKYIFILFLSLILIQCQENIAILDNGKYKVEFTGEFAVVPGYEIEVQDSLFFEMESNIKKTYKMDWKSNDEFQLILIPTGNEILTDINSISPSEYPYYKINDSKMDTVNFDYYQGIGVSTATGRFVRIRK